MRLWFEDSEFLKLLDLEMANILPISLPNVADLRSKTILFRNYENYAYFTLIDHLAWVHLYCTLHTLWLIKDQVASAGRIVAPRSKNMNFKLVGKHKIGRL